MRLTKRQLKRIIKEERTKLLKENAEHAEDFEIVMEQIRDLAYEAFELCGKDSAAEAYWFNTITGCIDGNATMVSMAQTLEEMRGGSSDEDMMEMGYQDGKAGRPPAYPENEFYMTNYEEGEIEGDR